MSNVLQFNKNITSTENEILDQSANSTAKQSQINNSELFPSSKNFPADLRLLIDIDPLSME